MPPTIHWLEGDDQNRKKGVVFLSLRRSWRGSARCNSRMDELLIAALKLCGSLYYIYYIYIYIYAKQRIRSLCILISRHLTTRLNLPTCIWAGSRPLGRLWNPCVRESYYCAATKVIPIAYYVWAYLVQLKKQWVALFAGHPPSFEKSTTAALRKVARIPWDGIFDSWRRPGLVCFAEVCLCI